MGESISRHPPLQRLSAIFSLAAVAAFGGDPVGPVATVLAARLPEARAGFQNPGLQLRCVWLIKPSVGILNPHEGWRSAGFLLDEHAVVRRPAPQPAACLQLRHPEFREIPAIRFPFTTIFGKNIVDNSIRKLQK